MPGAFFIWFGISAIAVPGGPFFDADAYAALFAGVHGALDDSGIEIIESPADINEPDLAVALADRLHALISDQPRAGQRAATTTDRPTTA